MSDFRITIIKERPPSPLLAMFKMRMVLFFSALKSIVLFNNVTGGSIITARHRACPSIRCSATLTSWFMLVELPHRLAGHMENLFLMFDCGSHLLPEI